MVAEDICGISIEIGYQNYSCRFYKWDRYVKEASIEKELQTIKFPGIKHGFVLFLLFLAIYGKHTRGFMVCKTF